MASSYDVINLSDLAVPDAIIVPEADDIFSAWLARLRTLDPEFDALVESDPTYKQGEVSAYQLTLAFQRVNDAVRAVFLASAFGTDLDQLGASFNVERQLITPADPDAVPPTEAVYEDDDAFRERIQLSWAQLNTAGSRNSYRYFAKSADSDVLDADAYGPEATAIAATVFISVLSRTGDGTASAELLDKVNNVLSADDIRPLTDNVVVKSAINHPYTIDAQLEIPDGPDAQTILDNAITAITSYTALSRRIKTMVPLSAIYAVLQQPGVSRVILSSPTADIEPDIGEAPLCTALNVTRKEVSGG